MKTEQKVGAVSSWKQILHKIPNTTYIFVMTFAAFSILIPNFFSANNISMLIEQASILMVLSSAMSLIIIAKGIDLSLGSIVSFTGIIMALLIRHGVPELLAIFFGILSGMVFGVLNGYIVVKLKVAPFIATFGMMGVGQGIANFLSKKRAVYLDGQCSLTVIPFLQNNLFEVKLGPNSVFGVNMIVIITIVVLGLLILFFKKTVLGTYIYALGGNREVAKLSNINTDKWNIFIYILTGIAGLLMLLRLNSAQPIAGQGLEFQAVVSAVLGGNLLSGGKGSIAGAIIGALVVYTVRNGLTLAGINSNVVMIVLGLILVLGMILNKLAVKGLSFKEGRA